MKVELISGVLEEVSGLIKTMDENNQTRQDIPGNSGLVLLREDSDELSKRKETPGGMAVSEF